MNLKYMNIKNFDNNIILEDNGKVFILDLDLNIINYM
jgi:hypothetical protein